MSAWNAVAKQTLIAASAMTIALLACSSDDKKDDVTGPGTTTGSLSGAVLDNRTSAPIAGATVSVSPLGTTRGGTSVVSGANGRFTFAEIAAGTYAVLIDARSIFPETGNPDVHYTEFILHETVVAGLASEISHPVFLPRIDETESTEVDGVTPTEVEPPSIPGLMMSLAAGATTFPGGGSTGRIAIVEIPIDRAPMSMPPGMAPRLLISIQPAGSTFNPPAPIRLPNAEALPPGAELDILSMDPFDGEFKVAARGRVTPDGQTIESIPGTGNGGITAASWHAAICDAHTVAGHVKDQTGAPIAGARVEVLSGINSSDGTRTIVPGGTAFTDASGNYSIPGVRVCDVRLRVTVVTDDGAGRAEPDDGVMADADGTTEFPDITVTILDGLVGYAVEGHATYADGSPAAGAQVLWSGGFGGGAGPQFPSDLTDATGFYRIEGLAGAPNESFNIFASQETMKAVAFGSGNAPSLAETGSTVVVDLTLCTEDDIVFTCPLVNWTLRSGGVLEFDVPGDNACTDLEISGEVTLLSLTNGVLVVRSDDDGVNEDTFQRVTGSGPSGVSAANLPGIYRRTAIGARGEGELFIQFRSSGELSILQDEGKFSTASFEAGTYSLTGSNLSITPLYSSEGPPDDPGTATISVTGTTLTVVSDGETEVFTRCEFSSGTGFQGMWTRMEGDLVDAFLMIGATEYTSMNFDDIPRRELPAVARQMRTHRMLSGAGWFSR